MTRWVKALCGVGLLWLVACADSHGENAGDDGAAIKPRDSTETGNPPVIDISLIALVVTSDEVHVTGESGAVTPGGIEVEVETVASGDKQRGPVAKDGSFDVEVDGSPDDTYVLRALGAPAGLVSAPVYVYRGGAMVGSEDGGVLTCEQRSDVIVEQLDALAKAIDTSCSSNSDCTALDTSPSCPRVWYCNSMPASTTARAAIEPELAVISEDLCGPLVEDGCSQAVPLPSCERPPAIVCVNGECTRCDPTAGDPDPNANPEAPACDAEATCTDACATPMIEWQSITQPSDTTVLRLTDCESLTISDVGAGSSCTGQLPCLPDATGPDAAWSTAQIQNALAAPDVQAALASNTHFGPSDFSGRGFILTVGNGSLSVGTLQCNGAPECVDETYDVNYLRVMLESIAQQQACQ